MIPYLPDGGDRDAIFMWMYDRHRLLFPEAEICLGTNIDSDFNRGKARNRAFESISNDILVIVDADTTYADPEAIFKAVEMVDRDYNTWVIPYGENRYYNLSRGRSQEILLMHPKTLIPEPRNPEMWEHKITSWAGLLVMHRKAFEAVGGYDERFIGWGFEDNAFALALDAIVSPHRRIDASCLHLWHPRDETIDGFQQPNIEHNRTLFGRYQRAAKDPSKMKRLIGK